MYFDYFRILEDQNACQTLAQKNDRLDCLDDCSWKCFKEAYVIAKVSAWDPVLITGPNGTGKTGYAKLIWSENECSDTPKEERDTLSVNCAAFSENLIASELFGHEAGSFTGAKGKYIGKIRTAYLNKQCLFLDEVGDLPMSAQTMLLRFFDSGEVQPVGRATSIKLKDVKNDKGCGNGNGKLKVVCATNKNLEEEVKKGNFREDLFNRINKYRVTVPPLKERPNDCLRNFHNFFEIFKEKQISSQKRFGTQNQPPWLESLKIDEQGFDKKNRKYQYSWPGNFRELQNRLQQAIVQNLLKRKAIIEFEDLFPENIENAKSVAANRGSNFTLTSFDFPDITDDKELKPFDLEQELSKLANAYIQKAVSQTKTKQEAAVLLGYSSYQKMDRRKI